MEPSIIHSRPVDIIKANIYGLMSLLDFLKRQEQDGGSKGRLVVFSSVTIYGSDFFSDRIVSEEDTDVTDRIDMEKATYSQSKRTSEIIANAYYRQKGIDIVNARFSTVYGDTMFKPNTAFFEFLTKAINGNDIIINSVNTPRRDNIYISDAISALLILAREGISGEAYNISSGGEMESFVAIDEIAEMIKTTVNKRKAGNIEVLYRGDKQKRMGGLILNNSKLKKLGWKQQVGMKEGIEKTIDSIMNGEEY